MTTQTEALKLADALNELLESFEKDGRFCKSSSIRNELYNRLKQTLEESKEDLAQPEHEKERCVGCEACIDTACGRDECPKGWPKAPQHTWVGLTDEEVIDLWPDLIMHKHTYQFWQNLEAKLKEKNT